LLSTLLRKAKLHHFSAAVLLPFEIKWATYRNISAKFPNAMALFVEVLRYKPKVHGVCEFFNDVILPLAAWPWD
jgi:hypothetical protein